MTFDECNKKRMELAKKYAQLYQEAYFYYYGSPKQRFIGRAHNVYQEQLNAIHFELMELDEWLEEHREILLNKLNQRIAERKITI